MNAKLTRLLHLANTYLPLAGTVVILLVATFESSLLDSIPLALLLAVMAISFLFVAVHLEHRLSTLKRSVQSLDTNLTGRVSALEKTHKSYLEATTPDMRSTTLAKAFDLATHSRDRIGHLRVYAISSQQIFSFVSNSDLTIDRCSLLIQGFPPDAESDFAQQVRLVARDWRRIANQGRIRDLEIRSYDYFPTDYEVFFDSDAMILGLFDSDPEDYSKVGLRGATLIDGVSPEAQALIAEFRDRFDGLFEACKTEHGPSSYDNV